MKLTRSQNKNDEKLKKNKNICPEMPLHSEFVTQCVKQITNSIFTTQKYIHDQYWYIGI